MLRRCVKCLRIVIKQCPLDSQHRTEMCFVILFSLCARAGELSVVVLSLLVVSW